MDTTKILELVKEIINNIIRLVGRAVGNLANNLEYLRKALLEFFKGIYENLLNQEEFIKFVKN